MNTVNITITVEKLVLVLDAVEDYKSRIGIKFWPSFGDDLITDLIAELKDSLNDHH